MRIIYFLLLSFLVFDLKAQQDTLSLSSFIDFDFDFYFKVNPYYQWANTEFIYLKDKVFTENSVPEHMLNYRLNLNGIVLHFYEIGLKAKHFQFSSYFATSEINPFELSDDAVIILKDSKIRKTYGELIQDMIFNYGLIARINLPFNLFIIYNYDYKFNNYVSKINERNYNKIFNYDYNIHEDFVDKFSFHRIGFGMNYLLNRKLNVELQLLYSPFGEAKTRVYSDLAYNKQEYYEVVYKSNIIYNYKGLDLNFSYDYCFTMVKNILKIHSHSIGVGLIF